ncbi:MAG: cyclic nucleotide-binding domain-containing protein [Anaerolineae bacterium]|nr:cyclic nucleotide-binding domain-containing protein [Anaerolineae bacterium]
MKDSLIGSVPLFAPLSEEERQLLAERMRLEHHSRGELLFVQGEASGALYLITSGWVRLTAEGFQDLATLGPGSLVGETDLFLGRPRSTTAEATTETDTWVLAGSDLEQVIAGHPQLGIKLSRAFGHKIAQLTTYLARRLLAVPGFRELGEEELTALARRLRAQEAPRGSLIFQAGSPAEALYLLESGQVRLVTGAEPSEVDYVELAEGAVFGEMALLTGKPQGQTARAATDVQLWALPKADFDELCSSYPAIRRALSRELRAHLNAEDRLLAVQWLRATPLFGELPEEALSAMARRLLLQHVPAGEFVFRVGEPGDALYLVESGQVELMADGQRADEPLVRLGAGGFFGEMALLTGRTRAANARALENSNLWVLYRADFDDLLVRYPAISLSLNRSLAQRLAEADQCYVNQHLRRLSLLAGLSHQQLEEVAERLRPARYRAGERIYDQGSTGKALYLIESGEVRLLKRVDGVTIPLAHLGAGDFFGETEVLNDSPRAATVEVVKDADLWVLSRDDFEALLQRYPSLAINLSRIISRRLNEVDAQLARSLRGEQPVAEAAPLIAPVPAPAPFAPLRPRRVEAPPVVRPQRRREPRESAGILGGLQGLTLAAEKAAVWFNARTAGAKLRLAAVVLLLVWLCGIAAPVFLIRSLRSSGQVRTQDLAQLVYMEVSRPQERQPQMVLALMPTALVPLPTYTPLPTDTPVPTDTPLPTPTPTATPTPTDTPTPTPTDTPVPTATPMPPTPTPLPPTPTSPPLMVAAAEPTAPARSWDGRLDQLGVGVQEASVAPGQPYWKLVEARWADEKEAQGKHNIYVNVLDESGQRIIGQPVVIAWRDGKDVKPTEDKPEPEYSFNFNMYATLGSYNVYIEGLPSDVLVGAGLGDLPRPQWKIHTCFYLTFQRSVR